MRALLALPIGICLIMAGLSAQAWNKPTHMVSAAIAYADLKERNLDVIAKVVEVLKQHPHFDSDWAPLLEQVSADKRKLYLFMLASKWPDDVRTQHQQHDEPTWHYVNIAYRPGEDDVKIPHKESILTAFQKNRSTVSSGIADREGRAIALCWMLHVIGDITQPLHTIKLVTNKFPEPRGDKGGNEFFIREKPDGATKDLHGFWDSLITRTDDFQNVLEKADSLTSDPDLSREKFSNELSVQSFNDWAVATYRLAIDRTYLNGTLKAGEEHNGAVIPDDYKEKAKEVAKRQVVLSGYRISDAMVEMFGK